MIMGVSPAIALKVAVFFMGISRSEWIQLWAGLLGAIPAAVLSAAVAAGVAVTVLNRSNAHQQVLAAEAATEQQRLTDIQLEQQKRLSALQLAEQRSESAMVREKAAMADVLAAATQFLDVGDTNRVLGQVAGMQSAVYRWALESDGQDLAKQLLRCTGVLHIGGLGAGRTNSSDWRGWVEIVIDMNQALARFGMNWYSVEQQNRGAVFDELVRRTHELEKRAEDIQAAAA